MKEYCLTVNDYGLLEITDESLTFLPHNYQSEEKLIFKNSSGTEIIFYPQHDSIRTSIKSESTSFWCEEELKEIKYEAERLQLSYRSTNSYTLNILIEPQKLINTKKEGSPITFFDVMEVSLYKIKETVPFIEAVCMLTIPSSYRGGPEIELGDRYEKYEYKEELLLNNRIYKDVYLSECAISPGIVYQKEAGLLSFIDRDGEEWILDRVEEYQEEQAPDLELPDTSGQKIKLSELEGELILIDFWASWCTPCRLETEETLKPLYAEYKEKGLEILSVSVDTEREKWIQAIEEDEAIWYHVSDLQGYESEVFTRYEIYGIPTVYVIDEEMKILSKNKRGEALKSFVEEYLD